MTLVFNVYHGKTLVAAFATEADAREWARFNSQLSKYGRSLTVTRKNRGRIEQYYWGQIGQPPRQYVEAV